jgi:hypothetical protein
MFNTIIGAGAVGAGVALRYGSGQMMQLPAAPAPQHWLQVKYPHLRKLKIRGQKLIL